MDITNLNQARQWAAAWGFRPRAGILGAALDGLRRCLAISREYGHEQAEQGYQEAFDYLSTLEVL